MKNGEKYKTAAAREKAFLAFCNLQPCGLCRLGVGAPPPVSARCSFRWLDLEAGPEKTAPCPFCGGRVAESRPDGYGRIQLACETPDCGYRTAFGLPHDAVAAHNSVAWAVLDAKKARKEGAE